MRTVALIAVRLGSRRMPRKALEEILGKPMIERMIERVLEASGLDEVAVATTELPSDDDLELLARSAGVGCYRGPVDDVLGRMKGAAVHFGAERVVELLGDNPLVHAGLIDDVIAFHEAGGSEYASNVTTEHPHAPANAARFPVGVRAEVYTLEALDRAERLARSPYHRENCTTYMWENPDAFRLGYFEASGAWQAMCHPGWTFAVNYRQNFEMVKSIFEHCYPKNHNFTLLDVVRFVEERPELVGLMGNEFEIQPPWDARR